MAAGPASCLCWGSGLGLRQAVGFVALLCPAVSQACCDTALSPSLLLAPATNGDSPWCVAASSAGCNTGVIHSIGPQGARAPRASAAACQRPASIAGHLHLQGEGRMGTVTWTRCSHTALLRTLSAEPCGVSSFTRHCSVAAGQQDARAVHSSLVLQPPSLLPSPGMGLPPSPSTATGEWKLQPARRRDVGAALKDASTELCAPRARSCVTKCYQSARGPARSSQPCHCPGSWR